MKTESPKDEHQTLRMVQTSGQQLDRSAPSVWTAASSDPPDAGGPAWARSEAVKPGGITAVA
ncbi:hypothetical protein Ga0074812_13352 [Parafrankia irregularis]|uniref:Uncharacterized protein n=1 Tax=Parafrankia irregularis TaxID=795642 RepID=A0A0S4QYV2_9ACTN|nr:hypothetical protein Ga0074812_13352 [Parafrankia irregularis]